VLGALVWGGDKLAAADQEHGRVMSAVESYMEARPIKESVELRPMFGAADAGDASAASDSGGASFLGQLWQAVQVRGWFGGVGVGWSGVGGGRVGWGGVLRV
jgi:nuclear cap-binding protein subunit 1